MRTETIHLTLPLDVTFRYFPGRPAVVTLRNGDPGYPADPADVAIASVKCNGVVLTLTDAQLAQAEDAVLEILES